MSNWGFPTREAKFSEIRGNGTNTDPDFLYYNATVINNSTNTTSNSNDPKITFEDTRALPILADKSKYAVSVENFTINGAGKTLPILIPQIRQYVGNSKVLNTNPNNTIYDITLTWQYGDLATPTAVIQSTRSIQWIPENQAVWTKQPPTIGTYTYPQPEIDYYYCYSYSHWVSLMNTTLACAWGDIVLYAKNNMLKIGTKCPYFTYDDNHNLFTLHQDANTCTVPFDTIIGTAPDSASPTSPPSALSIFGVANTDSSYETGEYSFIGYNTNFESLITNLNTTYYSDSQIYPNIGTNILLSSPIGNESCASTLVTTVQLYYPENVVNVIGPAELLVAPFLPDASPKSPPYYVGVTQDYESTSSLWSPVATLLLATTFITVRDEYSGTPITIGTGNLGGNASTASFQKVLIETPIDVITAQVGWRGFFTYQPKVETLTNLSASHDSLKNLDIQFYWRNRLTNSLVPLTLYNGGSATARLMFKRIHE